MKASEATEATLNMLFGLLYLAMLYPAYLLAQTGDWAYGFGVLIGFAFIAIVQKLVTKVFVTIAKIFD